MDPASKSKNGLANHFGRAIELRCRALSVSAATGSNLSELVKRAPEMDNGNDHRTAAKDVVFKSRAARDPVRIAIRPATAIGLQLRISAPPENALACAASLY